MKILVATDAWHPQVNGVVRTLGHVAREARTLGAELEFLAPSEFWTLPMPSYPEIRLALPKPGQVERRLDRSRPDAIHIATEGPLGHAVRRVCMRRGLPFTTSLHTRFPDYLAERLPLPERWTRELAWAWLRRFHSAGAAVMAAMITMMPIATSFIERSLSVRGMSAPWPPPPPARPTSRRPARRLCQMVGSDRKRLMTPPAATAPAPM